MFLCILFKEFGVWSLVSQNSRAGSVCTCHFRTATVHVAWICFSLPKTGHGMVAEGSVGSDSSVTGFPSA